MLAGFRVGEDLLEMAADLLAMRVEHGKHGRPVGKPHAAGGTRLVGRVCRQHVRLLVLDVLQAVFETAQENVGLAQFIFGFALDQAAFGQQLEDRKRRTNLQRLVATTANELEDLGDELDFADAAGAELDVVGHVLACDFAANLRMQVAHGVDGAEIEILAEDEGASDLLHRRHPVGLQVVARVHGAPLDPGVALPFAALRDEVVFQGVERADQRAGVAVRAQAHVDAEDLAVGGDFAERRNHALAEASEEIIVFDALRPCGIAFLGVDENVIDVGRHIQLASAELAHADDQQALRPAGLVEWLAIGGGELTVVVIEREIGGEVGQQGHTFDDFGERRQAAQIAQSDVRHGLLAQAA